MYALEIMDEVAREIIHKLRDYYPTKEDLLEEIKEYKGRIWERDDSDSLAIYYCGGEVTIFDDDVANICILVKEDEEGNPVDIERIYATWNYGLDSADVITFDFSPEEIWGDEDQ